MQVFFKYIIFLLLLANINCNSSKSSFSSTPENNKRISDEELLDLVQRQTFNYFWDGAEPNSGMACERIHLDGIYPQNDQTTVTTGGTGFGLMAILVGIERGYIERKEALARFKKIVNFLKNADRFHGAWPHWIEGTTGKVLAFSKKDNGGDLVETAFLVQGLLTVKEYFKNGNSDEKQLAENIDQLWREIEWSWYTNGENVLFWHWSPEYDWEMNFRVRGYNECLIMYILAASSPTFPISKEVYDKGWASSGAIVSSQNMYGYPLVLNYYDNDEAQIGPLFWAHYSYLGLNPKIIEDQYADYWELTQNQAKIYVKYSIENPEQHKNYSDKMWGLTSSYDMKGYAGHRIGYDDGVISPTAALSSFPYTPKESMKMLRNLYENHDSLVGKYGPYDAFDFDNGWYLKRYLAIDQGPIPVMIENYRSGLLWNLFMKNEDVLKGLQNLNFKIKQND